MRLVRCRACDRHVLASATACPFCRTRTVIATIAIGFTLAGCPSAVYGGPPPQPPNAGPTPTPPEQEGTQPPRPDGTNTPPIEAGPAPAGEPAPSSPTPPK